MASSSDSWPLGPGRDHPQGAGKKGTQPYGPVGFLLFLLLLSRRCKTVAINGLGGSAVVGGRDGRGPSQCRLLSWIPPAPAACTGGPWEPPALSQCLAGCTSFQHCSLLPEDPAWPLGEAEGLTRRMDFDLVQKGFPSMPLKSQREPQERHEGGSRDPWISGGKLCRG